MILATSNISKHTPQNKIVPKITKNNSSFNISWVNYPIPKLVFDNIVKELSKNLQYKPFDCDSFECEQVAFINSALIKQYQVTHHWIIDAKMNDILHIYESTKNIQDVINKYRFSPIQLMKRIFKMKGISHDITDSIINQWNSNLSFDDHPHAYEYITKEDYDNLSYAIMNDEYNPETIKKAAQKAKDMELMFIKYFTNCGIKLQTEDDLRKDDNKISSLTPDVLFKSEVYINNRRVHWLEFKSYVGTNIPLFYKSNESQINKYINAFGNGAICFSHSFVETLQFNSMILDASAIKISTI